jgi:hypothetical protein
MNTTLTVERLRELREWVQSADGWIIGARESYLRDLLTLIEAHLSPSAELGRMGHARSEGGEKCAVCDGSGKIFVLESPNLPETRITCRCCNGTGKPPPPPPADTMAQRQVDMPADCANVIYGNLRSLHRRDDPPADAQAVVEGLQHARMYIRDGSFCEDSPAVKGRELARKSCEWLDSAITFLQQRPFSEELKQEAARYRWLRSLAHKNTAQDKFGDGAYWEIGFFAEDGRADFDAAIDRSKEPLLTRAAEGKEK